MANLVYVVLILSLFPDSYGSIETVHKYIHIHSYNIALFLLTILFLIRIKYRIKLSPLLHKVNTYFVFPCALIMGVFLLILNRLTYPNFVYSLVHLRPAQIYFIGLTAGVVLLLQQNYIWYKNNYKIIIFIGGILLFIALLIGNLFPFGQFIYVISGEDGFLENVQNMVLVVSCYLSSIIAYYFFSHNNKFNGFLYTGLFLALIFQFGEEISWGQGILLMKTPIFFNEHNVQNEISIHNLSLFHWSIDKACLAVCSYGLFAWIIRRKISIFTNVFFDYYIPRWFTSSYFFIGFIFYAYNLYNQEFNYWYESMELLIYMGVTLFLLTLYLKTKKILT